MKHIAARVALVLIVIAEVNSCSLKSDAGNIETQKSISAPDTQMQSSRVPTDTTEQHRTFLRNNFTKEIFIRKGTYKTGKDKIGVFNFSITADNTTDYKFDSVLVYIPFYHGGDVLEVQKIKIKNIPAHDKVTVKVRDNKTADRFQVQLRKAYSSELQLCFDIDDPNHEGDDPYKCK